MVAVRNLLWESFLVQLKLWKRLVADRFTSQTNLDGEEIF